MPEEDSRRYLCVGIDRATRWVYMEILPDNGKEFTDRFCATGERRPTGQHAFDQCCREHAIEHRLIQPGKPQINDMVERFNGHIGVT